MFKSYDDYTVMHPLVEVKNGEMVFVGSSGKEVLKRNVNRGEWQRTDARRRRLSFKAFALSEPGKKPKIFEVKTADIDSDENDWANMHCTLDEFRQLTDLGMRLSNYLDHDWTRQLFWGTFDALLSKGCCDVGIARVIGLIVCVQSILADKNIDNWLKSDDEGYLLTLRLTRALFLNKFQDGDDVLWRETMRFISAFLGINAYLDISPDKIHDNNY